MADDREAHRHFILEGVTTTELFSRKTGGSAPNVPERDRSRHAAVLRRGLAELRAVADQAKALQTNAGVVDGVGIQALVEVA